MRRRSKTVKEGYILQKVLVALLGGECRDCGVKNDLQFDHVYKRYWNPGEFGLLHRMRRYRSEVWRGLIQLLCGSCNKSKGQPKRSIGKVEISMNLRKVIDCIGG